MSMQDSGGGIQDTETRDQCTDADIPSPESERRLHWRCRRGLLELDIVLGRFVRQRYQTMDSEQRMVFDELLAMSDTELWDVITGKKEAVYAHQHEVLGWLREA